MKDKEETEQILTEAYRRMHRYTCAEATLQALLKLWKISHHEYSWATAGYLGAILSGKTTCGLLIGSSVALSLFCGIGKEGIPENHENERNKAIQYVSDLYSNFIKEFGSTQCKTLSKVDFSKGEEISDYIMNKKWKTTCDIYLGFVIRKCSELFD
ncbi:MAG: C-GCAxxG-C-C family (seleno)protein [Candidatus Hodarchaeota archaeon]